MSGMIQVTIPGCDYNKAIRTQQAAPLTEFPDTDPMSGCY